jgi:hypothetical protein
MKSIEQQAEEKFTSTNTGGPKLPTLDECQQAFLSLGGTVIECERIAIEKTHDFICRQLRAGD